MDFRVNDRVTLNTKVVRKMTERQFCRNAGIRRLFADVKTKDLDALLREVYRSITGKQKSQEQESTTETVIG